MPTAPDRTAPRVVILLGAAGLLALVVAGVAISGGGGGGGGETAPSRCIEGWNGSRDAIAYGRHNYGSHGYDRVQVTMLTEAAQEPATEADGVCAVVFGALSLDTEPTAAGQLLVDDEWLPLSLQPEVALNRVAQLQATAAAEPNASLTGEGTLVAN
jgi:hypothetical protein